jgi:poly-gamma-glutamate synthesis protein (capsule biosynthesis protein)
MSVGDLYLTRDEPMTAFGDTAAVLAGADFLFGNVEGPISDRGTPLVGKPEVGSVCLRAPLRSARPLVELNFSAATLANNHTMDFGAEALAQTLDILGEAAIGVTGAGRDLDAAHRPVIVDRAGTTIAMLGYTTVFPVGGFAAGEDAPGVSVIRVSTAYQPPPGVFYQPGSPPITVTIPNSADVARLVADISEAATTADLVVVQFHWGVAGHPHPLGYMRELGRRAIDAGAHLVIGNHPHLLLGAEIYRDVPILYNLNHFAFDIRTPDWPGAHDTLILSSTITGGRFTEHRLLPCAIDAESCDLSPADARRSAHIAARLTELSAPWRTTFTDDGSGIRLGAPSGDGSSAERAPEVYFDVPGAMAAGFAAARQIPTPPS